MADQETLVNVPALPVGQKWAAFRKIDPECWEQVAASSQGMPIWQLKPDWVRVTFRGAYSAVLACAGPGMIPLLATCFIRPDNIHELRVFSRMRGGEFYDSAWLFGEGSGLPNNVGHIGNRRLDAPLGNGETRSLPANAVWMIDPSRAAMSLTPADCNIRIFCAGLDETIDINARTLNVGHRENVQERQMRLARWQRLMGWLLRLRSIDKKAYKRINKPLRQLLDQRDIEQRIARLTEHDIVSMQQQGMLPPYLAQLNGDEGRQVVDSIRLQQSIATRQDVLMTYANLLQLPNYNPIPTVLMRLDLRSLDGVDLQILMTIGALREIHGFVEIETQRLFERRPDLKLAMQSPQGNRQLQGDPDMAALNAHPLAAAEQQDAVDVAMRKGGSYGPTTREITTAGQVILNIQTSQVTATMWGAGMAASFLGLDAAEQYIAAMLSQGPAWKIYVPYLC